MACRPFRHATEANLKVNPASAQPRSGTQRQCSSRHLVARPPREETHAKQGQVHVGYVDRGLDVLQGNRSDFDIVQPDRGAPYSAVRSVINAKPGRLASRGVRVTSLAPVSTRNRTATSFTSPRYHPPKAAAGPQPGHRRPHPALRAGRAPGISRTSPHLRKQITREPEAAPGRPRIQGARPNGPLRAPSLAGHLQGKPQGGKVLACQIHLESPVDCQFAA